MIEKPMLMTVREVQEVLRVHRPKVYDLIHAGLIEGTKVGADWRIKTESVEKIAGEIDSYFFEGRPWIKSSTRKR